MDGYSSVFTQEGGICKDKKKVVKFSETVELEKEIEKKENLMEKEDDNGNIFEDKFVDDYL